MTDDNLIMWSIGQIAERDSVSKAAVSKAVKKLLAERPDTPADRGPQGQVMRISLAHYDDFRERFVNPAKATAPIRSTDAGANSAPLKSSDSFEEARRQAEWLKVGREKIRHQEECGELIRRDKWESALRFSGLEIQRILNRLPNAADDLALAVSKEGIHGVRTALRKLAFAMGNEIADKLSLVASEAPEGDELIEADEE